MSKLLSQIESDQLLERIKHEWGWSGYYWFPLQPTTRKDVVAFEVAQLEMIFSEEKLKNLLKSLGFYRILEHRENDLAEVNSVQEICIYGMSESVFTDPSLSWIIYCSHEQTITFGGDKLVNALQNAAQNWSDALCTWGCSI
jgi:hypothetical protein